MKLHILPARQGALWVKLGIQTFFKQPLALSGLFFLFLASMSVVSLVPFLGNALALALLPGATLGLMAATKEASNGQFPMPTVLISAFRAGQQQMRAMLVLGALYAVGFLLVMALTALVDGGKFAELYLLGGTMTVETLQARDFQIAALLSMALYIPLSLLFWHAPALVHWHGISPVKALFFSLVACMRNFWAFTVYGLVWLGVFMFMGMLVASMVAIVGSPEMVASALFPSVLIMSAMFFTSIYFTFRDSFEVPTGDTP